MSVIEANVLKDLESMFGILDIGWQILYQGCHNMIKKAGNEFSGGTAGRDDRSTWVVGLVNFGKKVHDRSAWCGGDEVLGGFRKVARGDEVVNGVRNGALMGECQILINPTVKSGVI